MSDRFDINAQERGIVRLFAIDLPQTDIKAFSEVGEDGSWPLLAALGARHLEPDDIEVFPVSDLTGLGLAGYMAEGLGIAEADVAEDRARLDGVRGHVLVVISKAFGGVEQQIAPRAPLRWLGTYVEEHAPVKFAPLPDETAKGEVPGPAKARPSDAAMSGRVATVALLVMFALVALMIWVAS